MTVALRQKPLARVVMGIVKSANGAWFDPSDLSTLYQDAAGTTPVTAVEQPVGLILDKSQGLELGLERVVNGDNEAGISAPPLNTLTNFTSKVQSSERAQSGNYSVKLTSNSTSAPHYWHLVSVSAGVSLKISGWVYIPAGTTANQPIKLVDIFDGSYTPVIASSFDQWVYFSAIRPAKATAWALAIGNNDAANWNGGSIYIDNLSVREIKGNHATQSITASRPVLSARYNLLTKTEDFNDSSAWLVNSADINPNVHNTPFSPELLADKITIRTTPRVAHFLYHNLLQYVAGTPYTYTHHVAYAGYRYVQLTFSTATHGASQYANFDLQFGVVTAQSGGTASIESTANGFFKISFSATATTTSLGGAALVYIDSPTSGRLPLLTGDGLSGYYLFAASLVIGTSAGPYQRVNTATDYDTDERYFKKYLRFDGVDDYLNLPYMGLYAGGSASVVAAYDLHPLLYNEYLISERSASETNSAYMLQRKNFNTNKLGNFIRNSAGVAFADDNSTNLITLPVAVISTVDSGSTFSTYINSTIGGAIAYVRSGVVATTNTVIGASVSTTTGNQFRMNLYSLIITKSALSDAQRIKCERYAASKAGVIL